MSNRMDPFTATPRFLSLVPEVREMITEKAEEYRLSFQDLRGLIEMASDFEMWGEGTLADYWDDDLAVHKTGKNRKQAVLGRIKEQWNRFKDDLPNYKEFIPEVFDSPDLTHRTKEAPSTILGDCPVASPKTRCCNLQTLDAVINCGFDCSYCSIQSFYDEGRIWFQPELSRQLANLTIDPNKTYHIGTGQSSDSLLWGNEHHVLTDLFEFARKHPNVILELKSKSARIDYLLNHSIPGNVIVTWSLNTPTIIKNEEQGTASLEARFEAAKRIAGKGTLIGFHFHPMVLYQGWKDEYSHVFTTLRNQFDPGEIALISFGTLTYIKSVLQKLRDRKRKSKILQMPLVEAAGKFSYPLHLKEELFTFAFQHFADWDDQVFLYMCMEDQGLWKKCFGREYSDNEAFETDMKSRYFQKIEALSKG